MDLRTKYLGLDLPHPLMPGASPLVMVWNNAGAGVPDPQPVVVDDFSMCAD